MKRRLGTELAKRREKGGKARHKGRKKRGKEGDGTSRAGAANRFKKLKKKKRNFRKSNQRKICSFLSFEGGRKKN